MLDEASHIRPSGRTAKGTGTLWVTTISLRNNNLSSNQINVEIRTDNKNVDVYLISISDTTSI